MPAVNDVGEPCAGEPHARFDGGRLETERRPRSERNVSGGNAGHGRRDLPSINATAPAAHPTRDRGSSGCGSARHLRTRCRTKTRRSGRVRVSGLLVVGLGRCAQAGQGAARSRLNAVASWARPGPVSVQAQPPAAASAHQPGGDVADAVAECGGFTARQRAVEAQRLGPSQQIRSGQRQLQPDPVLVIAFAGKVAQPGCLAGPDPVFDPGVGPVPDLQVGQLTAGPASTTACTG